MQGSIEFNNEAGLELKCRSGGQALGKGLSCRVLNVNRIKATLRVGHKRVNYIVNRIFLNNKKELARISIKTVDVEPKIFNYLCFKTDHIQKTHPKYC